MTSELKQEFFRVWDKNQNKMFIPQDNINYCKVGGYIVGIEIYQNMIGSIKPVIRPTAIYDNAIIMQCTGLKDKNGKLIYEGDIIKYAEFDWTDFSFKDWETEIAQVVWGNTYDNYYPAFDLKDTDFDGTNSFAYLFNEGWTIEVIGNIYENPELLED